MIEEGDFREHPDFFFFFFKYLFRRNHGRTNHLKPFLQSCSSEEPAGFIYLFIVNHVCRRRDGYVCIPSEVDMWAKILVNSITLTLESNPFWEFQTAILTPSICQTSQLLHNTDGWSEGYCCLDGTRARNSTLGQFVEHLAGKFFLQKLEVLSVLSLQGSQRSSRQLFHGGGACGDDINCGVINIHSCHYKNSLIFQNDFCEERRSCWTRLWNRTRVNTCRASLIWAIVHLKGMKEFLSGNSHLKGLTPFLEMCVCVWAWTSWNNFQTDCVFG